MDPRDNTSLVVLPRSALLSPRPRWLFNIWIYHVLFGPIRIVLRRCNRQWHLLTTTLFRELRKTSDSCILMFHRVRLWFYRLRFVSFFSLLQSFSYHFMDLLLLPSHLVLYFLSQVLCYVRKVYIFNFM